MTTGKLSPTPRSTFKVQVYIVKLLKKKDLKDFIYYNYG